DRSGDYLDSEGVNTPHGYAMASLEICDYSLSACTFANVHLSVMATEVPGFDGIVADGGIYPVTIRFPIFGMTNIGNVLVYDEGTSVTNETLEGHWLEYGYITRTITMGSDGIYLGGYGSGLNTGGPAMALTNFLFGPGFWNQQNQFTRSYFYQHFSPSQ